MTKSGMSRCLPLSTMQKASFKDKKTIDLISLPDRHRPYLSDLEESAAFFLGQSTVRLIVSSAGSPLQRPPHHLCSPPSRSNGTIRQPSLTDQSDANPKPANFVRAAGQTPSRVFIPGNGSMKRSYCDTGLRLRRTALHPIRIPGWANLNRSSRLHIEIRSRGYLANCWPLHHRGSTWYTATSRPVQGAAATGSKTLSLAPPHSTPLLWIPIS
jgi:hypothetical protein